MRGISPVSIVGLTAGNTTVPLCAGSDFFVPGSR